MTIVAGDTRPVIKAITVNATGVVYGDSLDTTLIHFLGTHFQFTSVAGTPDVKIEWESSFKRPATENAADSTYVVPGGTSGLIDANVTDEIWHGEAINPPPNAFGRIKLTGNAGNPADTVATVWVFRQG